MVVQVDADAMDVLGMLEQEPSAVERLLTGRADVAGRLILISSFLFGADPFSRCEPPFLIVLSPRCHLDAHFDRDRPSAAQLQ